MDNLLRWDFHPPWSCFRIFGCWQSNLIASELLGNRWRILHGEEVRIHGTNGLFTYMKNHIQNRPNVGKYTIRMDPMGMVILSDWSIGISGANELVSKQVLQNNHDMQGVYLRYRLMQKICFKYRFYTEKIDNDNKDFFCVGKLMHHSLRSRCL